MEDKSHENTEAGPVKAVSGNTVVWDMLDMSKVKENSHTVLIK